MSIAQCYALTAGFSKAMKATNVLWVTLLGAGVAAGLGGGIFFAIATPKKVIQELNQQAHPLQGVQPNDDDFSDLEPIGQAIGDARIVALGEATHGTAEHFTFKHRLFRYLVERKGFTVMAFEASWPHVDSIDRFIKTGEGTAREATQQLWLGLITHEVANLIQWMRDYNQRLPAAKRLSFTGFDSQGSHDGVHTVLNDVCQYQSDEFPWFYGQYEPVLNSPPFPPYDEKNPDVFWDQVRPKFQALLLKAEAALQRLDANKAQWLMVSGRKNFIRTRQAAARVVQSLRIDAGGNEAEIAIRDHNDGGKR